MHAQQGRGGRTEKGRSRSEAPSRSDTNAAHSNSSRTAVKKTSYLRHVTVCTHDLKPPTVTIYRHSRTTTSAAPQLARARAYVRDERGEVELAQHEANGAAREGRDPRHARPARARDAREDARNHGHLAAARPTARDSKP